MTSHSPAIEVALLAILAVLAVALALAFLRVMKGPSAPDRVVGLDLFAGIAVGMISAFSALSGQSQFLQVAMGLALISFLGTVAVARYLEKSVPR